MTKPESANNCFSTLRTRVREDSSKGLSFILIKTVPQYVKQRNKIDAAYFPLTTIGNKTMPVLRSVSSWVLAINYYAQTQGWTDKDLTPTVRKTIESRRLKLLKNIIVRSQGDPGGSDDGEWGHDDCGSGGEMILSQSYSSKLTR